MQRSLLLLPVFLLLSGAGFTQSAADWWFFGNFAGMHFNPTPSAVTVGALSTYEGCNTISTPQGSLLFYTDGVTVWNKNHAVMTNGTGLMGGGSSTQSGIVVPKPGSISLYYIFTVAQNVGAAGMRYSLINMNASGGLGAVTATKNVQLVSSTAEKLVAIKKPGGYWVLTWKLPGDTIYAYEVTSAGVNHTPVKSNTGVNLTTGNFYGYLKASPQGDKLAAAHQGVSVLHVMSFNKITGQVGTAISITQGTGGSTSYGVEFSPNGQYLYAQSWNQGNTRQYDLTAGSATAISSSEVLLGSTQNSGGGALQLGPDGKIYVARFGQTFVDVINNPDASGTNAGYSTNAVSLSNRVCRWGLPSFIHSIFAPEIEIVNQCFGDTTYFLADTTNVDSVHWNFGDLVPFPGVEAKGDSVYHVFSDTGTYTVKVVLFHDSIFDTVDLEVLIYPYPSVNLGPDTSLCVGKEFVLDVSQPFSTYLWHDGSTDSSYLVTYPDSLVSVTVYGYCDTVYDSKVVNYYYPFVLDLPPDTSMCTYSAFTLKTGLPSSLIFSWNNGSNQPSIVVDTPGVYSVTVTNGLCSYTDTTTVGFYPKVTVDLGNDSSFCYVDEATLTPYVENAATYQWSANTGNATTPSVQITKSGSYSVTVTGAYGQCVDSSRVTWNMYHEPTIDLGPDTSFCVNDILRLEPHVTDQGLPLTFRWNDNSNQAYKDVNLVGLYWVEVKDDRCSMRDSIIIDRYPVLDVTLGEDIKACDGQTVTLRPEGNQPLANFKWNTGSTDPELKVTEPGLYAVSVDNNLCHASDQVNVFFFEYPEIDLGGDTMLCPGTEITYDLSVPLKDYVYIWNDGDRSPIHTVKAGEKVNVWVKVVNQVCTTHSEATITHRPVPSAFIGRDTAICKDDELTLRVKPDERITKVSWSTGATGHSTKVKSSGIYTVTVSDSHCNTIGKRKVSYREEPPAIELEVPDEICLGESYDLDVYHDLFTSYRWQDGSTSSRYVIEGEGLYWVEATHACGVVADTVVLQKCECPFWAPNAFNPDGDGLNDGFAPASDCRFVNYRLTVYDRWGNEVFKTNDYNTKWKGTINGYKANEGAYAWEVVYQVMEEGVLKEKTKTGTVLLLR